MQARGSQLEATLRSDGGRSRWRSHLFEMVMNECRGPTPPLLAPLGLCPAQDKMQGNSAGVFREKRADRLTAPSRA